MADQTLDQKIADLTLEIANLTNEANNNLAQIKKEQQSYKDWVANGNWDEAHRHSDAADVLASRNSAIQTMLPALKTTLQSLQDQKTIALSAQSAVIAQANADVNKPGLTPEQQFQLQLAKINADNAAAATNKSATDLAKAAATTNQKYWIAAIVIVIVSIAAFMYFKPKTKIAA